MTTAIDAAGDGQITVECAHSDCDEVRTFATGIEPVADTPTRDDWELLATIDGTGAVQIHEAYCPAHRMETALKKVISASKELSKSTTKVAQATQAVSDVDVDVDE